MCAIVSLTHAVCCADSEYTIYTQVDPNHPIYNALDRENTTMKMKTDKPKKYPVMKETVMTTDGRCKVSVIKLFKDLLLSYYITYNYSYHNISRIQQSVTKSVNPDYEYIWYRLILPLLS